MSDEKTIIQTINSLHGGLILSCQAEGDSPFNSPENLALFAQAGQMGGACAIRACGVESIKAIRQATTLPIIGLTKDRYSDGSILITTDFSDIESLVEAGASIIALDATNRKRPNGLSGDEFLRKAKSISDLPVMADISNLQEGVRAIEVGADLVATTLSGYTTNKTQTINFDEPDWPLLEALTETLVAPIIMEGRIWTPQQAHRAIEAGAFAVTVGTAITRPINITKAFVQEIRKQIN